MITDMLDEATYERDSQSLSTATSIADDVYDYLRRVEDNHRLIDSWSEAAKIGGWVFPLYLATSNKLVHKMVLGVGVAAGDSKGSFGVINKPKFDSIIILKFLLSEHDLKYISTRFAGAAKSTLIHELTHYIDYKRYTGNFKKSTNTHQMVLDKKFVNYVNDPLEYNAHYIQAMADVEAVIEGMYRYDDPATFNAFMSDFKEFVILFKKMYSQSYLALVNSKYKKKILKRMYTTYNGLKVKYK